MNNEKQRGFTLIELLITMAIVGILAAIAYPSYQKFVIKGQRATAESAMMDISNREQQYFLANRAYTSSLLTALNYAAPSEVSARYTATVTIDQTLDSSCATAADTVPSFVVAMTPLTTGPQAGDGTLYLSSAGVKCPSDKW